MFKNIFIVVILIVICVNVRYLFPEKKPLWMSKDINTAGDISIKIMNFHVKYNRLPGSLKELENDGYKFSKTDIFGQKIFYLKEKLEVRTLGRDGKLYTDDDYASLIIIDTPVLKVINEIEKSVLAYEKKYSKLPESIQILVDADKKLLKAIQGHTINKQLLINNKILECYFLDKKNRRIIYLGPDEKFGTEDDIPRKF
jgi:regulator of extracellular matrix RemA (YlzA/DUF370 family)